MPRWHKHPQVDYLAYRSRFHQGKYFSLILHQIDYLLNTPETCFREEKIGFGVNPNSKNKLVEASERMMATQDMSKNKTAFWRGQTDA